MRRRDWILWALASAGSAAVAGAPLRIAAAWQRGGRHQAGVLRREGDRLVVESVLDVPSRPHAVRVESGGTVLVVARRPGDWLVRWTPGGSTPPVWQWIDSDRAFNGHVLASLDGTRLFTTETDQGSGQSVLGVRDARSLEKIAEWPTHGTDAHDLQHDGEGGLIVANGGVTAQQETGRLKLRLDTMDSSLVRLGATGGELRGQWRVADRRLSLRHLAWTHAGGQRVLGVSMQAEHTSPAERAAAPLLARFDGRALAVCEQPAGTALAGYGGDITATGDGFAIGCPRGGVVATWSADGRWRAARPLAGACPLLTADDSGANAVWAGGQSAAAGDDSLALPADPPLRLDNHWAWLPPPGPSRFNLITKELT
jgi:hypothetical protein